MALRISADRTASTYGEYHLVSIDQLVQSLRFSHLTELVVSQRPNQVIRRSSKPRESKTKSAPRSRCIIIAPHHTAPTHSRTSAIKSKSASNMPTQAMPKKQVRFDPTPRTESDNIYLGKTPAWKSAEEKRRLKSQKATKPECLPIYAALGLGAVGAALDATKNRSQRKSSSERKQEDQSQSCLKTPKLKPTKHTVVFVSPDASVLAGKDWALRKKNVRYGWERGTDLGDFRTLS